MTTNLIFTGASFTIGKVRYSKHSDRGKHLIRFERAAAWRRFKRLVTLWSVMLALAPVAVHATLS